MTVEQLVARMRYNPQSPLFARLAEEYLHSHRVDEALQLCEKGLQHFPHYTTAHVVAALCFAERGELQYALQHIEGTLRDLPDNTVLTKLHKEWREKSGRIQEAKSPDKSQALRGTPIDGRESKLESTRPIPSKSDSVSPSSEVPIDETTLEEGPIVSITLAEIYAMQGAYQAAIAMYRKLKQLKPQQAEQFETKMRELREKLQQRT